MQIVINIEEKNITRWGSIIILDPMHGPKDAGIALPGFEYNVEKDKPVFIFDWRQSKEVNETVIEPEKLDKLNNINKGES